MTSSSQSVTALLGPGKPGGGYTYGTITNIQFLTAIVNSQQNVIEYIFGSPLTLPTMYVTVPATHTAVGFDIASLSTAGYPTIAMVTATATASSGKQTNTDTRKTKEESGTKGSTGAGTTQSAGNGTSVGNDCSNGFCATAVDPNNAEAAANGSLYKCSADGSGSNGLVCSRSNDGNSSNKGPIAAAAVMGALFAIALVALVIMFCKNRRRQNHTALPPHHTNHDDKSIPLTSYSPDPSSQKVAALESQVAALQAAQLSAPPAGAYHDPSAIRILDDRTIASRFDQLSQSLKDWTLSHHPHAATGQASSELLALVGGSGSGGSITRQQLLSTPKTRLLFLRAAVAAAVVRAFDDGSLICGGAMRAVEKELARSMGENAFEAWRASTYAHLSTSSAGVVDVARQICALLAPFAVDGGAAGGGGGGARGGRERELVEILQSDECAGLFLELGRQPARWRLVLEVTDAPFRAKTADDVLQEARAEQLEGRPVVVTVWPGVQKWGNGDPDGGEGGWEECTVVGKARCLVDTSRI